MATAEMQRRERESANASPSGNGSSKRERSLNISGLCEQMRRDRLIFRYPREARRNAVMQYVGQHYSEEGTAEEVPINLLALYISIVSRSLIAKNPRVMLSTFQKQNKPVVKAMQGWVNKEMADMQIAKTLQRWVVDALFSVGILKVGLATPSDAAHLAWNLQAGQPFAASIDLDDFICDMHARDWSEVSYIGHRYRVPLDTVRDSSIYNKSRKNLVASYDPLYNEEGDERIGVIGRTTYSANSEPWQEMVDLWEIYSPRHRLVFTLASDQAGNPQTSGYSDDTETLRTTRWIGSDAGPIHILGFQAVPGNLLPKSPVQDLYDLHMTANNIYRKLTEQSRRQKQVLFVTGSATEDGGRIQTANDGDIIRVDHPDRINQVDFGGPNQVLFQMFLDCIQQFSRQAGNLEMLGGLGPQSKTATQDKLLNANASGTMMSMQETVATGVSEVIKAMCWYYHHDPYKVQKSVFSLAGTPEISVMRHVTPGMRQNIKWDEMEISIDPYSMQMQTPQMRMAQLRQTLQEMLPLMPMLQQQGIAPNMNFYLEKTGEYMDEPDLQELFTIAEPPEVQPQGSDGKPPMLQPAQAPERTYNRISTSERTPQGDQQMLMASLRGINQGGPPESANANLQG